MPAPSNFRTALRAYRDRLGPTEAGLPDVGGRRSRGLRREELAALAGISVDYVTRLEQGRATAPSAQVVAALARALQLDAAERDYLFRSAGLLPPQTGDVPRHLPVGVQRLVARLGDLPLAVFAADWSLLTSTPLWALLVGDPRLLPAGERNMIYQAFLRTDDGAGSPLTPTRSEAGAGATQAALVADLRTAAAAYPRDLALRALVALASRTSGRFAELWASNAVGVHTSDRKTLSHPRVGEITLDCDILTVPGSDLKIVVYTATAGSPDADKVDLLRVLGAQTWPSRQADPDSAALPW